MFQPLSIFVGLRYVRSRTRKFFVSFITWVSLIGVCVGVAALIVILSVMNGFETELRERLLSLSAHARVTGTADAAGWKDALAVANDTPGVQPGGRRVQGVLDRRPRFSVLAISSLGARLLGSHHVHQRCSLGSNGGRMLSEILYPPQRGRSAPLHAGLSGTIDP
ncbi:MAG: ABC transporter permease [Gammaproteobacteria bacterium]|nr:ABC transporter permease [Gammaproteobacteria bacterium]